MGVTVPLLESPSILLSNGLGIRPPLKWAGGKRWLVPELLGLWKGHENRRLVEPFCGGLAVCLGLLPQKSLLNDANEHAINFYLHLKKGLKISEELLNDEKFFYEKREEFNNLIRLGKSNSPEAARIFYYLNRTGFNGLCRFNRQGEFNVPFGRYTVINYVSDFTAYKEPFSKWDFTCGDFESVKIRETDFIYADPPYDVDFRQYSKDGFSWDDQERLADWLAKHKGPVILSNQSTPRIKKLYKSLGFKLREIAAPRLINCTGDRTKAIEVLAIKGL